MENRLNPGQIQWHTSEEDGLPDVGMLLQIDAEHSLWVGEISRALWGSSHEATELSGDGGWWIVQYGPHGPHIIGKCAAAFPHSDYDWLELLASKITAESRALAAEAKVERLERALASLVNAKALSGVREQVAGWDGEGLADGFRYERHPNRLWAEISTNCGAIYELDDALEAARALSQEPTDGK